MEKKVLQEKVFLPVKRQYYTFDEYGVLLLDEDFLKDSQEEAREEMVVSGFYRPKNDEDDGEVEADADDVPEAEQKPESVEPSAWQFDDVRRDVKIGGKVIHFQSVTQFRLLKYAARGGTSLQEAWEKVWGFTSRADWDTIKQMAKRIKTRLQADGIGVSFTVNTKNIFLHLP